MERSFEDSGVFNINNQWATGIQYDAVSTAENGELKSVTLRFVNGQHRILTVKELDRSEAIQLIGEENVATIEKQGAETSTEEFKGSLRGTSLVMGKAFTNDYRSEPENTISAGIDQEEVQDETQDVAALRRARQNRRDAAEMQRRQNRAAAEHQLHSHEDRDAQDQQNLDINDSSELENEDRSRYIPEHLQDKFLRVGDNFYFRDETPAFNDIEGKKLRALSSHHEVVSALIDIAVSRDWEGITVRGKEDFKKAVWLQARLQGLEVAGYKPTELDLAQLAAKQQREPTLGEDHNEVERGIQQERKEDIANSKPLRRYEGTLMEYGAAPYQFDSDQEPSYYIKINTHKGLETVWGKDLPRAIEEAGVVQGEVITLDYLGSKSVVVNSKIKNEAGKVIGTEEVAARRNTWNITRAEQFRTQTASEIVAAHPDLASSAAAVAAVESAARDGKIVDGKGKPVSPAVAEKFVAKTKETVAKAIENGKPLKGVKLVQPAREQVMDSEKSQEHARDDSANQNRRNRNREINAEANR